MIRSIVFDMDDTLYPEIEFVFGGYKAVSDEVKRQKGFAIYEDLVELFGKGCRGDLFTPVLCRYANNITETYVRKLVAIYRAHKIKIKPFPETKEVLKNLQSSYKIGLISDGYYDVQKRKFDALCLHDYFDSVIFSDKWGRDHWKPHPYIYKESAKELDTDFSEIVYVGDNPNKDFITANKLGIKTIRVLREGTLHQNVRLSSVYEADFEVTNLEKIFDLIHLR